MTCIIGLVHDGRVYMGGDSQRSRGSVIETAPTPKVVRFGDMLIGSCGLALALNLIQHRLEVPKLAQIGESGEGYLFREVATPLRRLAKDHDLDFSDCELLIGFDQRIFRVGTDFSVLWNGEGLASIGAGERWAIGAMLALEGTVPAEDRIRRSLEIAGRCCDGVAGPYYVMSI